MVGGRTIAEAQAHVRSQQQELKNFETLEHYEKSIGDLEKERSRRLDTIADQVARGIIKPEEGLTQSKAVIDEMARRTTEMAQAGLTFAQSIAGANPSPELLALISKFEHALQYNSGGQNQRAFDSVFKDQVEAGESKLNEIIGQRNQLIELENLKVEMVLQSRRQAQQNIMAQYAATRPMIEQHIAQIEAMARAYTGTLTPEMQQYFDALRARMAGVKIEAQGVDASFTSLRGSVNSLLTSNIVGFIDSVAQSFADLVGGQGDVLDFFASIGLALLKMIASILQTVAMLIIQAIVLDAVDKATGGILKPLLQITAATVSFNHEGGIAGRDGFQRKVNPMIFANAPRYHTGGIAGLEPDETAAVLRKGEEVLTESDPRHRLNGGLSPQGSSAPTGLRQILAIGDDEIANAMAGAAGERTVMTLIKRNKTTIRQMLDN